MPCHLALEVGSIRLLAGAALDATVSELAEQVKRIGGQCIGGQRV
jgi:hypothetical protein